MSAPAGSNEDKAPEIFDFVIVGSGAGGGPLAANLAEAGMRVLLLEAGGATEDDTYRVPVFHAQASEDRDLSWAYLVQHYADPQQAMLDSKYVQPDDPGNPLPRHEGIFYPRGGTLGGCTAHHALITVYPHDRDFDDIATSTGDPSWRSDRMRSYFQLLEAFHLPAGLPTLSSHGLLGTLLASLRSVVDPIVNPGRHGFDGWLPITFADPKIAIGDFQLMEVLLAAAEEALIEFLGRPLDLLEGLGLVDPNDQRVAKGLEGVFLVPISTTNQTSTQPGGRRSGARKRVLEVQARLPDKLVVRTGALVTQVVLDQTSEPPTAVGVDYIDQSHQYKADRLRVTGPLPGTRRVRVRHEVVLAAGTFNTPQLLKLSGIGPAEELTKSNIQIDVKVDLPGVGKNLQDRYEIGVVSQAENDFTLIEDCTFTSPGKQSDICFQEFQRGKGVYTSNGAVISFILKSRRDLAVPDLFIFGLPADFHGYQPGYSEEMKRNRNRFTWVLLKAHTANRKGHVELTTADPRDPPDVQFNYFGTRKGHEEIEARDRQDLEAVVKGIKFARAINQRAKGAIDEELVPGPEVQTDEELRQFVKDNAWGHHACGTCKIGPADDAMAVVDSRFRVHGVRGLRVVDASVFPRIPGFFIVAPTYMISEKASDDILEDARAVPPPG